MFLVALLYAMFASIFTISKTGLEYTQPFFFIGTRMLFAGVVILLYYALFDRSKFKLSKDIFWKILLLAIFNIYLTNAFEFWGLQYLTSFKTCFIYSLSPFISAMICYYFFSEKMTIRKVLGLTVGMIGFLPMLLSQTAIEEEAGHLFLFSWAEISVLMAAICSVCGWILLQQTVKSGECTPFMANGISMLIGGGIALTHSRMVENWDPVPVTEWAPFLECAIVLVLISNITCYNLYGYLLKKFSATFMSFAGLSTSLFSALFGWFFLNEEITWAFYLSTSVVSAGLIIFYQEELRQARLQEAKVN